MAAMGFIVLPGGLNRGRLPLLQPVSQVGAINLERVADLTGVNRSGIDPVDEGVAVDVDVLGSFSYADVPRSGAKFLNGFILVNTDRRSTGQPMRHYRRIFADLFRPG
jgi:hypothetical protein